MQPIITIKQSDLERLEAMLNNLDDYTKEAEALEQELSRAKIVADNKIAPNTVTMHAKAHCFDELNKKEYHLTLVYPHEIGGENCVSVLAPVGSALLGLSVGQQIKWQTPEGKNLKLTLLDVAS